MSYVNRAEAANFQDSIKTIRAGAVPEDRYLVFLGEPGMGKTEFLAGVAAKCGVEEIPFAVISALTESAPDKSDILSRAACQLGIPADISTHNQPTVFVKAVKSLSRKNKADPIALLFDDLDRLPESDRDKLQAEVFAPLTDEQIGNVVIAATATDEFRIPRFDLRRTLQETPLRPFTEAETAAQVGNEQLGLAIHALTFGLPSANRLALNGAGRAEIVSALLPDKEKPDEEDETAVAVSPLRRFGYALLGRVVASLQQDQQPKNIRAEKVTILADDLEDRHLIRWNQDLPAGYSLYPTARRIAAEHLKETQPEIAKTIHRLGFEHYNRLFAGAIQEKKPGWAEAALNEAQYHAAELQKLI